MENDLYQSIIDMAARKHDISSILRKHETLHEAEKGKVYRYVADRLIEVFNEKNIAKDKQKEIVEKVRREVDDALAGLDFKTTAFSVWLTQVINTYVPKSDRREGKLKFVPNPALYENNTDQAPISARKNEAQENEIKRIECKKKAKEFWEQGQYAKAYVLYHKAREYKHDDIVCKLRMEEFKKMLIEPTAKEITDALRSVDALSNSSV